MRTYKGQKAALTRAVNTRNPVRIKEECTRVVGEWDQAGFWPDDWSNWQRALNDSIGLNAPPLELLGKTR